jgi:hypothetical protein
MAATGPAKPTTGVAERLKEAPLSPEARALLTPQHAPPEFLAALVAAALLEDAIRATAFLLPKREAVWWAVQCVRSVPAAVADPKAVAALDAAAKWAASPTDETRRAAFAAAEKADVGTPAGAVGAAVYFAEGSLSPPKQPVVQAAPHLCPLTLANAVLLAAVVSEPEKADERRGQFVAIGADVAAGKDRWPDAAPQPARPPYQPPPPRPR